MKENSCFVKAKSLFSVALHQLPQFLASFPGARMPGNWGRKRILKEGLNLDLLQKCPSFEKAKSSSFTAYLQQELTVEYYGSVAKPHLSKIRRLHYMYQKVTTKPEASWKKFRKNQVASIKGTFTNSCNCFSFNLIIFVLYP